MAQPTDHKYIVTDSEILHGEPVIKGTRTPVRAIVETCWMGVEAEDIPNRLPHLTVDQVFDALSYYNNHQAEIDERIDQNRIPERLIHPLVRALG